MAEMDKEAAVHKANQEIEEIRKEAKALINRCKERIDGRR